jgi:hypothetical protein
MALMRTHINFATFLNYHGTTNADPLLYNYIEAFDDFCKFQADHYFQSADQAFIKWNLQYQTAPMLITEIPTFPAQTMANDNTLPVVVSATSTSTTTLVSENNTGQIVEQLAEEYLDDDIRQILNAKPMDNFPNSPTSSSSSFSTSISPPPELQHFPLADPVDLCNLLLPPPPPSPPSTPAPKPMGKDISAMIQHESEKKKRKRTANIQPTQHPAATKPKRKRSGRPTTNEALTKIANELDNNQLSPQNLILRAIDGSEKKKTTILTCSTENIELYNLKQFSCYEFLGEVRKKALDIIKEQKSVLEHVLYIEKIVTQHVERKKK